MAAETVANEAVKTYLVVPEVRSKRDGRPTALDPHCYLVVPASIRE